MRTIPCSRLLLRLLFFTFIGITCPQAEAVIHLKNVSLSIEPAKTVKRGSELKLTCNAAVVSSNTASPFFQFSFFKDFNRHNTVYISPANTSHQVAYTISNARASHSGTYQCGVKVTDNNYSDSRESTTETIEVKGMQTPVINVDKNNATEGDPVQIICSAEEESGQLSFIIKDGSEDIYKLTTKSSEVHYHHILKNEGMARLTCSYLMMTGTGVLYSNVSNEVIVNVKKLNLIPHIMVLPSSEVIEGDTVLITCQVIGALVSSALVSLTKGLHLIQNQNGAEFNATVVASDSGTYECSVMVNNIEKYVRANLTVKELFSKPVLSITPLEVFENNEFTITCTSSEFASQRIKHHDVKYTIYRDSQEITGMSDGRHMSTASAATDGNYTCMAQANNIIKWSQSLVFKAKVHVSKPVIMVLDDVFLGRQFRIKCSSETGSFPITYSLKENNRNLESVTVTSSVQDAIFTTTINSQHQIRGLRCEAQNSDHFTSQTSEALQAPVIVPVGKPNLLTLPVPDDISEDGGIDFVCSVSDGTLPITFKWYKDERQRPVHTDTVSRNYSKYSLPSVSSVHSGKYQCEVLNQAGKQMSDHVMVTVRMSMWKKSLIVSVCLLCVIGLVLALLIRYRAKRVKVTGSNGAGIWSVRPPGLESSEVVDVEEPEENVEYTEVLHLQTADPARVPLRKGTDTVYSEVQNQSSVKNPEVDQWDE